MSDVMADERSTPSDKHTQKIASHVSAYIHHVRTQLKQTIPKAIVHCLVRPSSPSLPHLLDHVDAQLGKGTPCSTSSSVEPRLLRFDAHLVMCQCLLTLWSSLQKGVVCCSAGDTGKETPSGRLACRGGVQRRWQAEANADRGRDHPQTPGAVHAPAQAPEKGCRRAQCSLILSHPVPVLSCLRASRQGDSICPVSMVSRNRREGPHQEG